MDDRKDLRMRALAPWVNGWGDPPIGIMAELAKRLHAVADAERDQVEQRIIAKMVEANTRVAFGAMDLPVEPTGPAVIKHFADGGRAAAIASAAIRRVFEAKLAAAFIWGDSPATTLAAEGEVRLFTLETLRTAMDQLRPPVYYELSDQVKLGVGCIIPGTEGPTHQSPDYYLLHPDDEPLLLSAAKRTKWPVRRLNKWRPGAPFAELRHAFAEIIDAHR